MEFILIFCIIDLNLQKTKEVPITMMIGEKIKTLRREMKLTQEQLAEYLDISSQAVSKWETGISSPDIDMLPRLAGKGFDIQVT